MKPTLRSIADELQLSTSLVSQVLNGKPGVWASAETRQRVLDAAAAVNYRPSASARALVTGRTMQIAVAMELRREAGMSGSSHSNGLIEAAGERGYRVVTVPLRDRESGARQIEELAQERFCDGVCLFSEMSDSAYLKALEGREMPTIVIGDLPEELDARARFAICIDHDNYRIGHDSAAWMLQQGYDHVAWAYSYGEADQPHALELRRGYTDAMRAAGCEPLFVPVPGDGMATHGMAPDAAAQPRRDARLQYEAAVALGADAVIVRWLPAVLVWLRAAREQDADTSGAGRLPVLALVERNEVWFLQHADVAQKLACLTWDNNAVGRQAANALIDWIEKGESRQHNVTVAPGMGEWVTDGPG